MLPHIHRLPGYRIPELLYKGKRTHEQNVTLIILATLAEQPTRFAVITPVKLSKKAAHRNRTKRLIIESIHHNLQHIKPGFDAVILAKRLLREEKQKEVEPMILALLRDILL